MKKYYLHDGSVQSGPFEFNDLKEKQINKNTPVWFEGLSKWTIAGELPELTDLIKNVPPPFVNSTGFPPLISPQKAEVKKQEFNTYATQTKPKSKVGIWRIIQFASALLLIYLIIASVVNYNDKKGSDPFGSLNNSYEQKVMTVEEIEQSDPAKFIKTSGQYRLTLLGNKFRILGKVTNNATVAKYKDISIKINYYSDTETLLHSETYVLYEYVTPHVSKEFELKVMRPAGSTKIGLETTGATPY